MTDELGREELLEELRIMKGVLILTLKKNQAYNLKERLQTIKQAYQQIKGLIQKPEDYEKNLADCTEAIDILIEQHEELCDEVAELREQQRPEVTEEWIEEKAIRLESLVRRCFVQERDIYSDCKDFIRSLVEEINRVA